MDEKISLEAIALYSDAYADKVVRKFFDKKQRINGQEILSLCDVQQINLFIVRELFRNWKEETRKLKSPYFNYEAPEVKEALDTYMKMLSQHISIEQQHFTPLVKKAVSQTLLMIFDPYDYYSMLITGKNNKVDVQQFQDEIKYIRINKAPLEKLLEKLKATRMNEVTGNEAFALLDGILEEVNFTPEDVDAYINQFSAIEKLRPEQFYIQVPEPPKPLVPPVSPAPARAATPVAAAPAPAPSPVPVATPVSSASRPTLADNFQRIDKIKEKLTINQKFMFTKVLFGGDFEVFSKTIDDLDRQKDMRSALQYLEEHYAEWDKESEEFHEFMELVEKRFS